MSKKTEFPYLRPLKARRLNEILDGYIDRTGHLDIREYTDVEVEPQGQIVGVSENREPELLIDDVDFCARCHKSSTPDKEIEIIQGTTLYGGYLHRQWGHFLMNSSSRLWPLFTDTPPKIDKILFFTTGEATPLSGNYLEFFRLLGLEDKIVLSNSTVMARHLIVPEISFEHLVSYSGEFLTPFTRLREAVDIEDAKLGDDIFMTRSGLKDARKNELNIDAIEALFRDNGFKIIHPQDYSLTQLVRMFAGAGRIASISGSPAHNFLFAPPDREFIIIERTPVNNYYQAGLGLATGIRTVMIDAFRQPRPAPSTGALFLYAATEQLERFITDRRWQAHRFPTTGKAYTRELRKFMRRHRRLYCHQSGLQSWEHADAPAISEACATSLPYYADRMEGKRPLFFSDLFHPHTLRSILRQLTRRNL